MIKESLITHKLSITKQKEVQNFQLALPRDTKRIIGIELSVCRKQTFTTMSNLVISLDNYSDAQNIIDDPVFEIRRTKLIGDLSLQTLNNANVFYRQEIKEADPNLYWGEVWETDFALKEWKSGRKRTEVEVDVAPTAILEGCYKDNWGVVNNLIIRYDVNIYLWIEKFLQNDH